MTKKKETKKEVLLTYKGFDMDLRCREFQYEVGKTYKTDNVKICSSGFHACENPLDIFSYYPPTSRFAEVEQYGQIQKHYDDSKVCSSEIKIVKEIGMKEIIDIGIKKIMSKIDFDNAKKTATGNQSGSQATGYRSGSQATGDQSGSQATGNRSGSQATGDQSGSQATGDQSGSQATGNRSGSQATGYQSGSQATGYQSGSQATGNQSGSQATGNQSGSQATGNRSGSQATGNQSGSQATGYQSGSQATGNQSGSQATGNQSGSQATGNQSGSQATGNRSGSQATGDQSGSQATGYQSGSQATGYQSMSSVNGYKSKSAIVNTDEIISKNAIAAAFGIKSIAKAPMGCWIVVAEWDIKEENIIQIESAKVDGKKIKENVFYELRGGKFIEC